MIISKKKLEILIEEKAQEILDNNSYIQEKIAYEKSIYSRRIDELTQLIDKYVKITIHQTPSAFCSNKIIIEYTPFLDAYDTKQFIFQAIENEINKEMNND